jgi:hypothetical protein
MSVQTMLTTVRQTVFWRRLLIASAAAAVVAVGTLAPAAELNHAPEAAAPAALPVDDLLYFGVSWAGIHCGSMTLESSVELAEKGPRYRIVMTARTSKFFDGIYRVRSRIESVFDATRMSSVSYRETSQEKKKTKDSLWEVDHGNRRVIHTENGDVDEISISSQQVYDPLAFIYRVRLMVAEPGDKVTLTMVTSDGDVDTVAEVVERKKISTPFGKREALRIVPRPKDEMLFSKRGSMSLWVATDDSRVPYRIEFDLSFGKLVAKLKSVGAEGKRYSD